MTGLEEKMAKTDIGPVLRDNDLVELIEPVRAQGILYVEQLGYVTPEDVEEILKGINPPLIIGKRGNFRRLAAQQKAGAAAVPIDDLKVAEPPLLISPCFQEAMIASKLQQSGVDYLKERIRVLCVRTPDTIVYSSPSLRNAQISTETGLDEGIYRDMQQNGWGKFSINLSYERRRLNRTATSRRQLISKSVLQSVDAAMRTLRDLRNDGALVLDSLEVMSLMTGLELNEFEDALKTRVLACWHPSEKMMQSNLDELIQIVSRRVAVQRARLRGVTDRSYEAWEDMQSTSSTRNDYGSKWDLTIWHNKEKRRPKMCVELMSTNGGYSTHLCQTIRGAANIASSDGYAAGWGLLTCDAWFQVVLCFPRAGEMHVRVSEQLDRNGVDGLDVADFILSVIGSEPEQLGIYPIVCEISSHSFQIGKSMCLSGQSAIFESVRPKGFVVQFFRSTACFDRARVAVERLKQIDGIENSISLPIEIDNKVFVFNYVSFSSDAATSEEWVRMVDVVKTLHANGVYHLDLCPNNFLCSDSALLLCDWGSVVVRPPNEEEAAWAFDGRDGIFSTRPFFPDFVESKQMFTASDLVMIDEIMLIKTIQFCATRAGSQRAALLEHGLWVAPRHRQPPNIAAEALKEMASAILDITLPAQMTVEEFREDLVRTQRTNHVCACGWGTSLHMLYYPALVEDVNQRSKEVKVQFLGWKGRAEGVWWVHVDNLRPALGEEGWRTNQGTVGQNRQAAPEIEMRE